MWCQQEGNAGEAVPREGRRLQGGRSAVMSSHCWHECTEDCWGGPPRQGTSTNAVDARSDLCRTNKRMRLSVWKWLSLEILLSENQPWTTLGKRLGHEATLLHFRQLCFISFQKAWCGPLCRDHCFRAVTVSLQIVYGMPQATDSTGCARALQSGCARVPALQHLQPRIRIAWLQTHFQTWR